ncbi:MAG: ATP-binding protein, partial [Acidimicrobiales bacterium]
MFRQLKLRDRLVIMAAAPLLVLVAVAIGLLIVLGTGDARPYGLVALAGVAITGSAGLAVGRSVLDTLSELTDSATALATAHRRLAEGEITVDDLRPIPERGDDHFGRLAGAINALNAATIEVSESQQSAVKAGLSNIVVNLARRSQTLLDRQVEYLDRLEGSEEDPDRLGELFKVDHLATRMRRNAESLLVLAEADPGRRRGGPVEIADVLRVAMGEVEAYQYIELADVDGGPITATAAVDLAHLTAELMENATQFSPPSTPVQVTGKFDGRGAYVITIADMGIGMSDDKLAAGNELLANPPELGLGMGRSLGFMVIGRLAQRLNATVFLQPNGEVGAKAVVTVPDALFVGGTPEGIVPVVSDAGSDQVVGVDAAMAQAATPVQEVAVDGNR